MLEFIMKILLPGYFEYQEEMERKIKTLKERELKENE